MLWAFVGGIISLVVGSLGRFSSAGGSDSVYPPECIWLHQAPLLGCKGGLAFCGGERTAWINNSSMNSQALLMNKEAVRHHGTLLAWESWSSVVREHDPNPSWSAYFSVIVLTLLTHLSLVPTFLYSFPLLVSLPSLINQNRDNKTTFERFVETTQHSINGSSYFHWTRL